MAAGGARAAGGGAGAGDRDADRLAGLDKFKMIAASII
jgi:hypothetical protein